jgi:opacity protein-like surface antigen
MRSKIALAALFILSTLPVCAQVAPAAQIRGLPLSVGFGVSDYGIDYGQGRRMLGLNATADYDIFHGLGIEAEGTDIFIDKPDSLAREKQESIKGGIIYKYHPVFHLKPYAKGLIGLGRSDFSTHNPLYYQDTFTVVAVGGGAEYRVWKSLYIRADYEYQWWKDYLGPRSLNPNGVTVGAEYYLRGLYRHN